VDPRRWRRGWFDKTTLREARIKLKQLRGTGNHRQNPADHQVTLGDDFPIRSEIAIDFQGLMKSAIIALLSGAERRIGFASYDLRERASRYLLTEQVQTAKAEHIIDKNIELARAIEPRIASVAAGESKRPHNGDLPYEFPIFVSPEDQTYVDDAIADTGRLAIVNPGGAWITKLWPARRYAEIIDWLWHEHAIKSFVTYGPGEEDLAQQVVSESRSGNCAMFVSTLKQFVALARRANLFLGGDTGPLHLAAAAGTPIVGLYGPTSPERNGPFNVSDMTIGRDLWCRSSCYRRRCWHWECMEISAIDVKQAIEVRLQRSESEGLRTPGVKQFVV
jgi:ADP-heptose:LPS heptosyltransferase